MSSSKLGELPGFGQNRGLSSSNDYDSSQLDLDDALGSLLGDSSTTTRRVKQPKKDKAKTKPSNSRKKGGSNSDTDFYSQLAHHADDSNEDMVEITPVDTKKMADSVDVDDMEASLFGSFSRSQNQRRQSAPLSRKSAGPSPSPGPETKGAKRASLAEQGTADETSTNDVGLAQPPLGIQLTPKEKERPQTKKFELDDDILDLLSDSDSEDKAPKKRVKPKIQLKTNPKQDESASNHDSKPITSNSTTTQHAESDSERPKTSHGRQAQLDTSVSVQPPEQSGKVDILKLDTTPEHPNHSSTKAAKPLGKSSNSTNVDFGDEDDDILSGMGFDDSNSKAASTSATKQQGSRLDELLGKKKAAADENKHSTSLTDSSVGDLNKGDEDGFQFGGYLPSVVTDSSSASGPKLPGARRRRNSDSLTSRPSSAPGLGKKTVRFAEAVENENRPSSSPAVNDTPKPALKDSRRAGAQDQESKPLDGSSTSFSGKPPLPRKSEPSAVSKGQSEVIETLSQDEKGKTIPETDVTAGGEQSLTDNNDSLFPWHESTPKQSSSRTRGRRPSQQKSMAGSLFEESQETPEGDQDEFLSIGNQSYTQESTSKLERPTFPWQKSRQSRNHSDGAIGSKDSPNVLLSTTNKSLEASQQPLQDQGSVIASFQEQLFQQQKQMQEQLKTLQSHQAPVSLKRSSKEEERLSGELKNAQKRTQEVEMLVEDQKSQLSAKQVLIEELQLKVQSSEEGYKKLEEEYKVLNDKVSEIESSHQKAQVELQTQLEELKMKLYKVELERDQLKQSIDSTRSHHTEEMESVQKSHDARIKAMEDSFQRRETRWREEAELESIRYQERLQQLEKEKTDVVLTLKKKMDALEVSKTNEIGRLQDIHYSSVEDLKREHELDKQHLLNLHRQEVEALKAAHSHTRMLSDLSRQVESSTREVSQLQAKLESTHSKEMQEQVQRARTHEEQLKTLEERLLRQQAENSAERERLQSLIAKLEMNISQQRKQIEQERWELQQETNKMKIQQKAFEEERMSSLQRIDEDKETLQQAKERFLSEQHEVLTKCYEERRVLASERAELTVLQKRMQEKEQLVSTKNMQVEAEYEATLTQIREESARITSEARQLKQDQQSLKVERESLNKEREKLDVFNAELQRRSQGIEEMHQSAVIMRENGEQALSEAHRLQEQLAGQSQSIQSHWAELREKETRIATELLSLAHQRRELQQVRHGSRLSTVPTVESVHSLDHLYLPPQPNYGSGLTPTHSSLSLSHPPLTTTVTDHPAVNHTPQLTLISHPQSTRNPPMLSAAGHRNVTNGIGGAYSPRASPVHAYDQRPSVKAKLEALEQSRSLRNLQFDARKDKEVLEEEIEFLESLQLQNSNVKQLVW